MAIIHSLLLLLFLVDVARVDGIQLNPDGTIEPLVLSKSLLLICVVHNDDLD